MVVRDDFRSLPRPGQGGRYVSEVSVRMQAAVVDNLPQLLGFESDSTFSKTRFKRSQKF